MGAHEHEHGVEPHPAGAHHHHRHEDTSPHPHAEGPGGHHHPYAVVEEPQAEPVIELPTPDVVVGPGDNLQRVIDMHPADAAIEVRGDWQLGSQIQPKGRTIFAPEFGAAWFTAGAYRGTAFAGPGRLINLRVGGDGMSSGVQMGDRTEVIACEVFGCVENGIGSNQTDGGLIDLSEIHHCGNNADQGDNAGGIKLTATSARGRGKGVTVRRTKVHDVEGNGVWLDVDAGNVLNDGYPAGEKDCGRDPSIGDNFDGDFETWDGPDLIEDVDVWACSSRGLFVEVSRGVSILRRVKAHGCNTDRLGNGAGIGVSAAKNVLIEDFESWDNYSYDVSVGQITRSGTRPWYPGYYTVRRVVVRCGKVGSLSKLRGLPGTKDALKGVTSSEISLRAA